MATSTTNYSFTLPAVADPIDEDLWGGQLNANWTSLDSLLLTASNFVTRSENTGPVSTSVTDQNKIILVDATSGAITVNLLAAATAGDGFRLSIKKVDSSSNAVTVDGNAAETIDGAATQALSNQYDVITIISDGTNWSIQSTIEPLVATSLITTGAADGEVLAADGSGGAEFRPAGGNYLNVVDQKSSGTDGGTFTSGSWQTRDLNTVVTNEISGASLASNQITLADGTYYISASAPGYFVQNHKARLRNITHGSDEIIGSSEFSDAAGSSPRPSTTRSFISGRLTVSGGPKDYEIQHQCNVTRATDGFGRDTGFGVNEVYTIVEIWKVS